MQPKLAVSGYRGVWGTTLTEDIAREYVRAFAELIVRRGGTKVILARDARASGPVLLETAAAVLLEAGLDVIDIGMCATPSVLFLCRSESADGAIIITASHNPIEYNGIKFVTKGGAFTTEADVREIEAIRTEPLAKEERTAGTRMQKTDLVQKHLDSVIAHVDVTAIRAGKFVCALDPINSVGAIFTPLLLEAFGAQLHMINGTADGAFAHEPEPLPKNLGSLRDLVKESGSAVGFAQDPDADRLVLCDENGNLLSEEMTLALSFEAILARTSGNVVINLSTSSMCEDVASSYGSRTVRSKVGEANVVAKMHEVGAIAGGEGGGGVIWPAVNPTRDSFVGIALILELLAKTGKKLSALVSELPHYEMCKEKVAFAGSLDVLYQEIRNSFPDALTDTTDGLRLDMEDRSWLHVRPSNTEPVVRIIAEAKTINEAENMVKTVKSLVTKA